MQKRVKQLLTLIVIALTVFTMMPFLSPGIITKNSVNNSCFAEASTQTQDDTDLAGQAYAVYDSTDHSLTFFRDTTGKYIDGQTDGTKTYYTGFEDGKKFTTTVKNATLAVYKGETKVESWNTDSSEAKEIYLAPGNYTLKEEKTPDGYVSPKAISFTVDSSGNITGDSVIDKYVVMYGQKSVRFKVRKTDYDTGEVVSGKGGQFSIEGETNNGEKYSQNGEINEKGEISFSVYELVSRIVRKKFPLSPR